MDVSNYSDTEGRAVGFYRRHNKSNQQFDIVYAKDWAPDPKKGELNKDFGLIVEKPFYVISSLSSGKHLDLIGRNMVIKTRNGRNTQKWWFDQRTKTIKNVQHKGWSWDIKGHGRSNQMQAWNTNSQWQQIFKWDEKASAFFNIKQTNRVLDVQGGRDEEGRNVQVHRRNGTPAQKW
jgi:hypothetical protein